MHVSSWIYDFTTFIHSDVGFKLYKYTFFYLNTINGNIRGNKAIHILLSVNKYKIKNNKEKNLK